MNMQSYSPGAKGFTMIELIATMVILGLIGAIGAVGFSQALRGYTLAASNAELAQKAQVALTRLSVELMHMTQISASNSTSITYTPVFDPLSNATGTHTIGYDSSAKVLTWDGNTLVDDVDTFSVAFYDDQGGTASSTFMPNTTDLIEVTLGLRNAAGNTVTFTDRIFPVVYKSENRF
ncbi:prepilin-type N-terminal cleavage/methylation domain-containing protein [Oceanidesulfovibrio marinus]|nr:prepilin-type N-terminal cleavage/methylation domain-containing protein [Oceanidesulfovibrio marinus]